MSTDFFAPSADDIVDVLVGEYDDMKKRINELAAAVSDAKFKGALHYFVEGNNGDGRDRWYSVEEKLFNAQGAIAALNSQFWSKAINLTDIIDVMPQKRRDEWNKQINERKTPDFEQDIVRATIGELLADRGKFFAEKVDGLFQALSRTHITNQPEGFGKRMILQRAVDSWGYAGGAAGYIDDLRDVIAKILGREVPAFRGRTSADIKRLCRRSGEWQALDGGVLRMRVYSGVGTAHLEIHPDIAWQLNCVLAQLHPTAIPSKFRQKPKKKIKDFELFDKLIPYAVIRLIEGASEARRRVRDTGGYQSDWEYLRNTLQLYTAYQADKATVREAAQVLTALGGVEIHAERVGTYFQFDYDPTEILHEVLCSGRIPDQRSHQFYPTPENLAALAVELAGIGDDHQCLEPSAGQGGIAGLMPKERTVCVEISELHAKILAVKGHTVVQADFMQWGDGITFDRIVMNPPYSEGRWQAHIERAASMLAEGDRRPPLRGRCFYQQNRAAWPGINNNTGIFL